MKLIQLLERFIASFENSPGGWSARKLTAFAFTSTAVFVQVRHANSQNLATLVIIDGSIALLALGIITAEQIIKFKHEAGK